MSSSCCGLLISVADGIAGGDIVEVEKSKNKKELSWFNG